MFPKRQTIAEKLIKFREAGFDPSELEELSQEEATAKDIKFAHGGRRCLFEQSAHVTTGVLAKKHKVFLGAHSYMNNGGYIKNNVFIGRYCSIGRRVTLGASMHRMAGVSTSPLFHEQSGNDYKESELESLGVRKRDEAKPTIIENDVWIGDQAIIFPGVHIGTGAVIGASAVVSKDVKPYEIVMGIPAKANRMRFPDAICEALLKTDWWEIPFETLKSLPTSNILEFLDCFSKHQEEKYPYSTYCIS